MHVTEGFPILPADIMASFSDADQTREAAEMIGLPRLDTTEEVADSEGSVEPGS